MWTLPSIYLTRTHSPNYITNKNCYKLFKGERQKMDGHQGRQIRQPANQSFESNEMPLVQGSSASTIDLIQNLKLDNHASREESDDQVPAYALSPLVERRPLTSNLRHLDGESQRPATLRQLSLPSLPSSAFSISGYRRSVSDGGLDNKTQKRRRLSSDDDSTVLTPLYQAVSAGASLDVIESLVQADPTSVGRQNGGGLTPLHCAIERYDTPVSVLMFLLESHPATAAQKCRRGFTPIDLLWKRFIEPDSYRSEEVKQQASSLRATMEDAVSLEVEESLPDAEVHEDGHGSITSQRQTGANLYLQDRPELRTFWEIMTSFIHGAFHGTTSSAGTRTQLVHEAVQVECPPLLIQFAAVLYPEELMEPQEDSGRLPLHIAVTQGSQDIIQTLLKLQPRAASVRDNNGHLPLHLAIQSLLPWKGAIEILVAAWPQSLTVVDPSTGLLPAMLARSCSTDVIFNLLCANPVEACRFALERTNIEE